MSLELAAMRWLWIEQKCLVVLEQRSPIYGMGLPDVVGVTPGRYLTEIEIKRSVSDFRADAKKPHRSFRSISGKNQARQFYYLMPKCVAEKVSTEIPQWSGLMTAEESYPYVELIKRAPVNNESQRLNLKQCARLARQMTNHVMSYALKNHAINETWRNGNNFDYSDWVDASVGTYFI